MMAIDDTEKVRKGDEGCHNEGNKICKQLETTYRKALAEFKADKTNKDLRRAKSAAKKAWDEAVAAHSDGDQLICRDCSQTFMFTLDDQKYYYTQGLQQPSRCRECAAKYRIRLSDRSKRDNQKGKNMCYAFQTGTCPFGDKCKFSHDVRKYDDDGNVKQKEIFDESKIGLCKWGVNCTVAKCRFKHPDGRKLNTDVDVETTRTHTTAMTDTCIPVPVSPNSTLDEENTEQVIRGGIEPVTMIKSLKRQTKREKKYKKIVVKAMTKALKKAPSRQMKIKELRRLIQAKADFKTEVSKTDLKKCITDVIGENAGLSSQDGKIVRLL